MDAIRPEDPTDPHRTAVGTVLWLLAAGAVLVGGVLHALIWNRKYRDLPSVVPGRWVVQVGFPVNVGASVIVAAALAAVAFGALAAVRRFVIPVALLLEVASLLALIESRRGSFFQWTEREWDADAKEVLVVEVLAVLALGAAAFVPAFMARRRGEPDARRVEPKAPIEQRMPGSN
ncbi:MAG: hypothetical protein ACR2LA_08050 [Acidimicrobiales bacterium]